MKFLTRQPIFDKQHAVCLFERETRVELAAYSLEGYRSTN